MWPLVGLLFGTPPVSARAPAVGRHHAIRADGTAATPCSAQTRGLLFCGCDATCGSMDLPRRWLAPFVPRFARAPTRPDPTYDPTRPDTRMHPVGPAGKSSS
ncbi:hypothetical protein PAPYR_9794 [Paratrimastix pyriformis]|uniref:Secreted protein n=1 Tax=Paratrimastix pyriformis TaxID=342808 RepID=A0ABQ8UER6_9EUKA|nr:hypothetical protein PAPYR_9794 [Paratrimastix pyriformis]